MEARSKSEELHRSPVCIKPKFYKSYQSGFASTTDKSQEEESSTGKEETENDSDNSVERKPNALPRCSTWPRVNDPRGHGDLPRPWSEGSSEGSVGYSSDSSEGNMFGSETDSDEPSVVEVGSSNILRGRSSTWGGEDLKSLREKTIRPFKSAYAQRPLVYYLADSVVGQKTGQQFYGRDPRVARVNPCVCLPSRPPSSVCTDVSDELLDEEQPLRYVDHRIYEDSYSAVTSTTTTRILLYTTTTPSRSRTTVTSTVHTVTWIPPQFKSTRWTTVTVVRSSTTTVSTSTTRTFRWWTFTTITARLTRYNLSRHPMTSFTVQEPYNFVPWGNVRMYGYTFRDFRAVGGRWHGHRHYMNDTVDSNITVIYGLKYSLNMTTQEMLDDYEFLDSVAFAIEFTKGEGYTTTTTTPPPPVVVKSSDCIKYGFILLGFLFALLFLQANRMLTIFVIGCTCLSVISYLNVRPAAHIVVSWLNLDYLFDLIFVMLLVGVTADTGLYDVIGYYLCKAVKCNIFALSFILCFISFVFAIIMDSVVAILLLTPIAIRTLEEGQMNPVPVLLSMILYCNMANILNVDYNYLNSALLKGPERWQALDTVYKELSFSYQMFPKVLLVAFVTAVYLVTIFALLKPHRYAIPEISALIHRQILLRIAASGIHRSSRHWLRVRNKLIEWHHELDQERLSRLSAEQPPQEPRPVNNKIRDKVLLFKVCVVVAMVIILVFLRRNKLLGLGEASIGWIVAMALGYLLIFTNPPDLNLLLWRMQWGTIISFMCLFFLEKTLDTMRMHRRLYDFSVKHLPNTTTGSKALLLTVIRNLFWGSFLMTALISNFAVTSTIRSLSVAYGDLIGGTPLHVLVFAVTFGVNVGGSATVLGSGVAIACCAAAWQQGYKITACKYMIFMAPITIINMCCLYALNEYQFSSVSEGTK
ncbi:P protein-like isoform X2 [Pectinophora gossypiella]|uniref:P protein-like isoform X2 n=1 Tax=Pectinophora gossypiella TaxID=13191 RepID=UPI00214ECBC8|nr:P protein-like isoform X2 [Pectinophora gossypiella]